MPRRKLKATTCQPSSFDTSADIDLPIEILSSTPPPSVVTDSSPPKLSSSSAAMTSEGISVPPPSFSGRSTDDAFAFVKEFERYVEWKNVTTDDRKRALFAVLLRDNAGAWYDTISDADKSSFDALRLAFNKRYLSTDAVKHRSARDLFTKRQAESETVDDFVASVRRLALLIGANDDVIRWVLLCGLKPHISAVVAQQKANTVDEILDAARLAELTATPPSSSDTIILDQLAKLQSEVRRLGHDRVTAVGPSRSPTPERRRVSFEYDYDRRPPASNVRPSLSSGNQGQRRAPPSNNWPPKTGHQFTDQSACSRCARLNCSGQRGMCTGFGKQCFSCGKLNHVSRACKSALRVHSNQPHFQY